MDDFQQRLIGAPKHTIVCNFAKEIYHQTDIVIDIMAKFGGVIVDHADESTQVRIMRYAVARGNIHVFMFILDNPRLIAKMISYSQMTVVSAALFVIQRKDIPDRYITQFFTLFRRYQILELNKLLTYNDIPNCINRRRLDIAIATVSRDALSILLEQSTNPCAEIGTIIYQCRILIASIRQGVGDDCIFAGIKHVKFLLRMYLQHNNATEELSNNMCEIAESYPEYIYGVLCSLNDSSPIIIDTIRRVVALCDIATINRYIPVCIFCYEHYRILIDSNINRSMLIKPLIAAACSTLNIGWLEIVAFDLHTHGYSLFSDTNALRYSNMLVVALTAAQYDDAAIDVLRSKRCRDVMMASSFPYYLRDTADKIFKKYHTDDIDD